MLTNRPARGREDADRDKLLFRRVRHPHLPLAACASFWRGMAQGGKACDGAGALCPAMGRLQATAYLALLFAVLPAATCIAMGQAGVPMLFSTACGVVSCAAGGHAF